MSSVAKKKKNQNFIAVRTVYVNILATFNNVIVSITTTSGDLISSASGGSVGLKGAKKSTPHAGTLAVSQAMEKMLKLCVNVTTARIRTKGPGASKESAARNVAKYIKKILYIQDMTSIPHNGCRPPAIRSV